MVGWGEGFCERIEEVKRGVELECWGFLEMSALLKAGNGSFGARVVLTCPRLACLLYAFAGCDVPTVLTIALIALRSSFALAVRTLSLRSRVMPRRRDWPGG